MSSQSDSIANTKNTTTQQNNFASVHYPGAGNKNLTHGINTNVPPKSNT